LQESGATALGPAMVTAISAAPSGSTVLLCTDGLANVGVGSLEDVDGNDEAEAQADAFYNRVGQYAKSKGVVVNIIGIEGCGCDVEHLGIMSDLSEGDVEKVAPMDLAKNFASALENQVIACKAQVAMHLHAGLHFRDAEGIQDLDDKDGKKDGDAASSSATAPSSAAASLLPSSRLVVDIGNVTEESDCSFEFQAAPAEKCKRLGLQHLKALPFQTQITYERLDGSKYVRVITKVVSATRDISVANRAADYSLLAAHAEKQCSRIAKKGDYEASRGYARAFSNFMSSHSFTPQQRSTTQSFAQSWNHMDSLLMAEEADERRSLAAAEGQLVTKAAKSKFRKIARSKKDRLSSLMQRTSKRSKRAAYTTASLSAASTPAGKPPPPSARKPPPAPAKTLPTLPSVRERRKSSEEGSKSDDDAVL